MSPSRGLLDDASTSSRRHLDTIGHVAASTTFSVITADRRAAKRVVAHFIVGSTCTGRETLHVQAGKAVADSPSRNLLDDALTSSRCRLDTTGHAAASTTCSIVPADRCAASVLALFS